MKAVARGGGDKERARTVLAASSLRANGRGLRSEGNEACPQLEAVHCRANQSEETSQSLSRVGEAGG